MDQTVWDEFARDQARAHELLMKRTTAAQGLVLCAAQNGRLHESEPGAAGGPTIGDRLALGLTDRAFRLRPEGEFETIAWILWHITRIEDAVGNLLIAGDHQVFDAGWQTRLGVDVTDTGNAFTVADVDAFGARVNRAELLAYRRAVGQRTRQVLAALDPDLLKTRPRGEDVERITREGVLTPEKDSIWLQDFWANKTLAGLVLLPLTRHQPMHLPNCFRLKALAG